MTLSKNALKEARLRYFESFNSSEQTLNVLKVCARELDIPEEKLSKLQNIVVEFQQELRSVVGMIDTEVFLTKEEHSSMVKQLNAMHDKYFPERIKREYGFEWKLVGRNSTHEFWFTYNHHRIFRMSIGEGKSLSDEYPGWKGPFLVDKHVSEVESAKTEYWGHS